MLQFWQIKVRVGTLWDGRINRLKIIRNQADTADRGVVVGNRPTGNIDGID